MSTIDMTNMHKADIHEIALLLLDAISRKTEEEIVLWNVPLPPRTIWSTIFSMYSTVNIPFVLHNVPEIVSKQLNGKNHSIRYSC